MDEWDDDAYAVIYDEQDGERSCDSSKCFIKLLWQSACFYCNRIGFDNNDLIVFV